MSDSKGRPAPLGTTEAARNMPGDGTDPKASSRGSSSSSSAAKSSRSGSGRSSSMTSRTRVQIGEYLLGKTLGIGSFGKVKLAEHVLTGQLVAIKILNRAKIRSLDMEEKVRREIQILKFFVHPHIIRLYEVVETPTDIFLVMEYVSGGELFDHIVSKGRLQVNEARQFFQQIVSGVAYCHSLNVVHRDLKPENLLLSGDNSIKVADFGLSNTMYDGEFLRTSCGSPNYAAPEVISGHLYAGPEVDIWSCGVILYALLCGSLPFDDESIPRLFRKIKNGHYNLPSHLDEASQDLIRKMLHPDPTVRIKIEEIRAHPFFQKGLPPYLALPIAQQSLLSSTDEVDEDCITEMLKLQHPFVERNGRAGILAAIQSPKKSFIKVIYNLFLDQLQSRKRAAEQRATAQKIMGSSHDARSFAFSPPKAPKSAPDDPRKYRAGISDPTGDDDPKRGAPRGGVAMSAVETTPHATSQRMRPTSGSAPDDPPAHSAGGAGAAPSPRPTSPRGSSLSVSSRATQKQTARFRKWYLGIQSKKDPELVMSEVFRALKSLRSQWHYAPSNPYRVTCRWRPSCLGVHDPDVPDEWVYVALQLYKVQTSIYLLDFQRTGGISGCFSFMRLCSLIINALKAPAPGSANAAQALAAAQQPPAPGPSAS